MQPAAPVYEVKNVTVRSGQNGRNSILILSLDGKDYRTIVRGVDERLQSGAKITNIRVKQLQNSYGKFNVLDGFDMAA